VHKFILFSQLASLAVLFSFSLQTMPPAFAQGPDEGLEEELIEEELKDEAPPPAEYPYPGATDEEFKTKRPVAQPQPVPKNVERPVKIDEEDGSYYYNVKTEPPRQQQLGNEKVKGSNTAGEFFYERTQRRGDVDYKLNNAQEKPIRVTSEGQFHYKLESTAQNKTSSLRLGSFVPTELKNKQTLTPFEKLYTENKMPVIMADLEWHLFAGLGRFGIKGASGIYVAQGKGAFTSKKPRREDDIPTEKFSFFLMPNQLTAIWKLQFADEQVFVPYAEGGAGYFTFIEARDDGEFKYGAAPVSVAAAGANILLDWLDRNSIRQLDNEYGINHVWFTLEYRYIVGLNKDYDFTSGVINGGVTMDF